MYTPPSQISLVKQPPHHLHSSNSFTTRDTLLPVSREILSVWQKRAAEAASKGMD